MPFANLDTASLSFRLRVLDAVAMAEHGQAVMTHFRAFILAYDEDLSKSQAWRNVPFKAQHDWAVDMATSGDQYDPAAFWSAYAKVVSEVFFLGGDPPASGVPHPAPGQWQATSLRAQPTGSLTSWYVWEYDTNTGRWVRQCYGDFDLTDPSGNALVSPTITIEGATVATVGASLAYGDAEGLGP
ncbi:MAG: hypothetical protein ACIAS6_03555 [Phycisphaerales bacterium JB060]